MISGGVVLLGGGVRWQLARTLQEFGCSPDATGESEAGVGAEGDESSPTSPERRRGAPRVVERTLEESWPLMQTMLAFAFGWNLGVSEGGRRVQAGWRRSARAARTSVLVDTDSRQPTLVVYEELVFGGGGRVLRGLTLVTGYQALLFGGRDGPQWEASDHGVLERWLRIPARLPTMQALGTLRAVTRCALQHAARLALERIGGQPAELREDERLKEWRACLSDVANLPALAPRAPAPHTSWTALTRRPQAGAEPSSWGAAQCPQRAPPRVGLPVGWSKDRDPAGQEYFFCEATSVSRWDPPGLGDALPLPAGWEATWDEAQQRHYYYWTSCGSPPATTWKFPSGTAPSPSPERTPEPTLQAVPRALPAPEDSGGAVAAVNRWRTR